MPEPLIHFYNKSNVNQIVAEHPEYYKIYAPLNKKHQSNLIKSMVFI